MAVDKTKLIFNPLTGSFDTVQDVSGLAETSDLANYIPLTQKAVANGVATLNGSGLIPNNQLPAISITDTFVVASQAAMLALSTAETGDVAVRTDLSKSFILKGSDFSVLADWQELLTPTDAVQSVNGQTGIVTLDSDDVPEGSTNLYYTSARFDARLTTKSTDNLSEGSTNLYFTNARAKAAAVSDAIVDGVTDVAPSQNAVFDALALKASAASVTGKASTDLSNLATTAINTDLLPDTDVTRSIGSNVLLWSSLFLKKIQNAAGVQIDVALRALQFDGTTVASWFNNGFQLAATKILRFTDDAGTNTVGLKAPATLAASIDYTLPTAAPTSNGQALTSTTAGVTSWSSVATNPMTTGGDVIYGGASGVATRLANGTAGQVLTSAGGTSAPSWTDINNWTSINSALLVPGASGFIRAATLPTFGTVSYNKARYSISGSTVTLEWDFKQTTAGTAGAGAVYLLDLPAIGLPALGTYYSPNTGSAFTDYTTPIGRVNIAVGGASIADGFVMPYSTTQLKVGLLNMAPASASSGTWSPSFVAFNSSVYMISVKITYTT